MTLSSLAQSESIFDLGDRSVSDPMIIFLHIPKSGGTSLNGIINQQYPKKAIFRFNGIQNRDRIQQLSQQQRTNLQLIRGHFAFGLHEFLPCPAQYFTLLRDPVARFISHYHYVRRSVNIPGHAQVKSLTLRQYTQQMGQKNGNLQTRLLFGLNQTQCQTPSETLTVARQNLEQHFAVVGLVEQFDETLVLLKRAFGWRMPLYVQQNVTSQKQKDGTTIDPETLQLIEQCNAMDLELYRYAQARFTQQIEAIGKDFEPMLRRQQRWNSLYQPFGKSYGKVRQFALNQLK
jgi:Galactose-3-O-sulfotransferase